MKFIVIALFISAFASVGRSEDIPFSIVENGGYRDGGTLYVVLKSTDGKVIETCIDRRGNSPTIYELFIGAKQPRYRGAQLAPESTRIKLVNILEALMSLEPIKYKSFLEYLEENKKRHKIEPAG